MYLQANRPHLQAVIATIGVVALAFHANAAPLTSVDPARSISLNVIVGKALARSPRIAAAKAGVQGSIGVRRQAEALPNPELSALAENVAGQGAYQGTSSAELTYSLSQRIELGGKRNARRAVAAAQSALSNSNLDAVRLDLIRDVTVAFFEATAAQEQLALAEKQQRLAASVLQVVSQRVDAAREPLVQRAKAQVTSASAATARRKAQRDLAIAKNKLSVLSVTSFDDLILTSEEFHETSLPGPISAEVLDSSKSPDLAGFDAQVDRAKGVVEIERANAIPDVTLTAGLRDLRATSDRAFVFGLSVPLPILDSNAGNIIKARADLRQTEQERNLGKQSLQASTISAEQQLRSAYDEVANLKTNILPPAHRSYLLAKDGYERGRLSFLEVLDAQRTLYEMEAEYIAALKEFHVSLADLQRVLAFQNNSSRNDEAGNE